tara:strand:- start:92 stop:1291 length:1200 start_codon:yes stop_codon:yes gene_type:complete
MFKTASELVSGDADAPEDNADSDTLVDPAHYRDASPLIQGLLFFEGRAVFPQVLSKLKELDYIGLSMLSRSCRACKQVINGNDCLIRGTFRIIDFVGSVERLKWAYNNGFPLTRRLREEYDFVMNGMKFMYGEDCDELFLDEDGNLRPQWTRKEYIGPADTNVCFNAAQMGNFPVLLEFCRQVAKGVITPCPQDENLINAVAASGRLSVLQKLRKLDCPWSATTCAYAAYFNRFDVYKWLRDAGCPYDDRVKVYNPSFVTEVDVFPEYRPYHLHNDLYNEQDEYDCVWAATLLRRQHQWIHVIKECNFAWVDRDGPEALEKGEMCEIHWNYTKFHTPVPSPVPSDDEEGEEDEDDHWDEDDIDEDDEDGFIISTDGPVMIEGEDLDFEEDDFDGDDAFE